MIKKIQSCVCIVPHFPKPWQNAIQQVLIHPFCRGSPYLTSVHSPQAPCSFVAYQVAYVHQRCKSKFAFSTAAKKWLSHKCKISEAQSIPRQCQTSVPGCSSCPFPLPLPDKFTPTNSMKLTQEQRDVCHCRNRLKKKITRGGYDTLRKGISAVLGQCSSNFFFSRKKKKK